MADATADSVRPFPARLPQWSLTFAAAAVTPVAVIVGGALFHLSGRWNDFASYWLAGKLLDQGANPYDLARLDALARREGVEFLLGTGYSYPLPFAGAFIPISRLPFELAAWVFTLLSIVAFAIAVAVWIDVLPIPGGRARLLLAFAAGFYPPVAQSAYYGQANLLVVALLAAGLLPLARDAIASVGMDGGGRRGRFVGSGSEQSRLRARGPSLVAGAFLGFAGLVKLVPLTIAVPLATGRRWAMVVGLALAAALGLAIAAVAFPRASGAGSLISQLFSPDVFWTNQSINGFASRLVEPSDRTMALAPGAIGAGLLVALLTVALAAAVLALLWRARPLLEKPDGLCLAVAAVLAAAVAGAPKDSFWNHSQALVALGLLLAAVPGRRLLALPGVAALVAVWYGTALAQNLLDQTHGSITRAIGPVGSVVASTALLGLLALFGALALALESLEATPERAR